MSPSMMRIIFRCAYGKDIGSGHVMRCLTLADALKKAFPQADCVFWVPEEGLGFPALKDSTYTIISGDSHADPADLLIVDDYNLDASFETACRPWAKKIFVLDDLADRKHDCDLLLDHNYMRMAQDYKGLVSEHCELLLGHNYILLREEFLQNRPIALQRRTGDIHRVLVSFGSTNIGLVIQKTLGALNAFTDKPLHLDLVVGKNISNYNQTIADITDICANSPHKITVHSYIDDMCTLMTQCDLSIGAVGMTSWERASLGLPAITIELADNQHLLADGLSKAGAIINLGGYQQASYNDITHVLSEFSADKEFYLTMARSAYNICDAQGTMRVVNAIKRII